jgi:hypothetical protein
VTEDPRVPTITDAVLDQWEQSARKDHEAGRTWSVHPLAILAVVAEMKEHRRLLLAEHREEALERLGMEPVPTYHEYRVDRHIVKDSETLYRVRSETGDGQP